MSEASLPRKRPLTSTTATPSHTNKTPRLESSHETSPVTFLWNTVPDIDTEQQHNLWDEKVIKEIPQVEPEEVKNDGLLASFILHTALQEPRGAYDMKKSTLMEVVGTCQKNIELREAVADAVRTKSFRRFRCLKHFRAPLPSQCPYVDVPELPASTDEQKGAVYAEPCAGEVDEADEALYQYIVVHSDPGVYYRLTPVLQASGSGRSRLIDRLSATRFVIPLNIGEGDFPPADSALRDWILKEIYQGPNCVTKGKHVIQPGLLHINKFFCTFLIALFRTTVTLLRHGIRNLIENETMLDHTEKTTALESFPISAAAQFRMYMTIGQKVGKPSILRERFYQDVMDAADALMVPGQASLLETNKERDVALQASARDLLDTLVDVGHLTPDDIKPRGLAPPPPRVIISFDNADKMTEVLIDEDGQPRSGMFSFLSAFRTLKEMPLSSTFVTSSWYLFGLPPPKISNFNTAIFYHFMPFCALGLDDMAVSDKYVADGTWTLEKVTRREYWVKLGRPLWAARFLHGSEDAKASLIDFAVHKLLGGSKTYRYSMSNLTHGERMAILATRLPLDFKPTPRTFIYRTDTELQQV
ncbi:hypothetical protein OBBRIDRAFT_834132 [Obba rivulosa]|uniref:Uncharacterized protein n=1 Tax=Obba rivulosa TaxID=1052685 RepID=A0A8E2B060_9APHY|nr:hypothetical protein OBBRIDRAFT_834132 [Obba rivulosa]